MALIHIPLTQVDEHELKGLIEAKAAEARDIEYKRDIYGAGEADHAEWLADVSSFANTAGGDLIIGINANSGIPTEIAPLTADLDREILRLEQIARSSLQPRIAHLEFKRIFLAEGGEVLVVRIPRSFNPPHRIVRAGKGQNRFWARSSAGKYEPNVEELRALFTLAPQLVERIRDFRVDRIARIAARAAPVALLDQTCLVLHVVPFSSLDPGALIPLVEVDKNPHSFAPIGSSEAHNWSVNFDGILIPSNANRNSPTQRAYIQVYRTGRLEAVASSIAHNLRPNAGPVGLSTIDIEGMVLHTLVRSLKGLQILEVEPPYAVMVSLIGTKGVYMNVGIKANWFHQDEFQILTESQYHFAEVIIETIPNSIQECGKALRPFIEQLANTAGQPVSSSFSPYGEYIHAFRTG